MRHRLTFVALGLLLVAPWTVAAQAIEGDPRIQVLEYAPARSWDLNTASGETALILLGRGERIDTVVMSDPGAYEVGVTPARDGLYVREKRPGARAIMTVGAGARHYTLDLTSDPGLPAPYLTSFRDPPAVVAAPAPADAAAPVAAGAYKLAGAREVCPASVSDDGAKTYIRWASDQSIPAVFALEGAGREETINGYMRDGVFTIDRIYERLIFRIDKATATATRMTARKRP